MQPAAAPTLAQRILAHLRDHPVAEDAARVPWEVTQEGIASCLDARVAHVSRALKHLMASHLVKAHLAHAPGSPRRCRAHLLTDEGRDAAKGLPSTPRRGAPRAFTPPTTPTPAGRARELSDLSRLLDESSRGALRVVLLEGDSGIGKTRVLQAFAGAARNKGARVLHGASVPLGGDQLLGPLGMALAGTSFETRVRARAGGTPRERALQAAVDALAEAAKSAPVALVLDDLHHAGPNAVEFLHGLLLALPATAPILCVAAFRREEAWELPNGPLYTALFPIRSHPGARHLFLGPLDEDGVASLLADAGMGHVSGEILARVVRESGGNPTYALAMGEALADGIDEEDFFPPAVRALAKERFMTLDPNALATLQLAAVAGAEAPYGVLSRAWETGEENLVRALDVLLDRLLLDEVPLPGPDGPLLRFEHPKVREAVLADMTASRRRWLETRIAIASEPPTGPPGPVAEGLA